MIFSTLSAFRQEDFDLKLTELQDRLLTSKAELPPTMESLSSWLRDIIPVQLVAYWNPRRQLSYCCEHGCHHHPDLIPVAQEIIEGPLPRMRHWRHNRRLFHLWMGTPLEKWDRILIIENDTGMSAGESNLLMDQALSVFAKPLRKALAANTEFPSLTLTR